MVGRKKILAKPREILEIGTVPQMWIAKDKRKRQRATRIRGIVRAARQLNVTRQHLRLVVIGERKSPALLARYAEMNGEKN